MKSLLQGLKRATPSCLRRPPARSDSHTQETLQQLPGNVDLEEVEQPSQQQLSNSFKSKMRSVLQPAVAFKSKLTRSKQELSSSKPVQPDAEPSAAQGLSGAQQAASPPASSKKQMPFKGLFKHKKTTAADAKFSMEIVEAQQEAAADNLIAAVRAPLNAAQQVDVQADVQHMAGATAANGLAKKVSLAGQIPLLLDCRNPPCALYGMLGRRVGLLTDSCVTNQIEQLLAAIRHSQCKLGCQAAEIHCIALCTQRKKGINRLRGHLVAPLPPHPPFPARFPPPGEGRGFGEPRQ